MGTPEPAEGPERNNRGGRVKRTQAARPCPAWGLKHSEKGEVQRAHVWVSGAGVVKSTNIEASYDLFPHRSGGQRLEVKGLAGLAPSGGRILSRPASGTCPQP